MRFDIVKPIKRNKQTNILFAEVEIEQGEREKNREAGASRKKKHRRRRRRKKSYNKYLFCMNKSWELLFYREYISEVSATSEAEPQFRIGSNINSVVAH